jgi:ferrous iron transport protein B
MWERSKLFLRRAGTIIFAASVVLWFLATHPAAGPKPGLEPGREAEQGAYALSQSAMGHMGRFIEPVITPLGYDWKIGVALVASLAAREVAVSALGTIYSVQDADQTNERLVDRMRADVNPRTGKPTWTPLVAASLMVFFVLACQCLATVAVVRRETASWRWPLFLFGYMSVLAWAAALLVYQGGRLLGFA